MGAAVGTDEKGGRNVDINLTPFVDLMTCLTAFLLVTAVWTNMAQINIKPKGIGRDAEKELDEEEPVRASILVTENDIWVGLTRVDDFRQVKKEGEEYNWTALEEILKEHKKSSYFVDREDIEVGAEDKVKYQTIITVMDIALNSGFKDVGLADPASLSAKPRL